MAEGRGGPAGDDRGVGNVGRHHGARADNGAGAQGDAGEERRVHADVGPAADAHRLDDEVRLDDRHVDRVAGVLAPQDLRAGAPADVLAENEIAAVEVALRTDPGMRADHAASVVAPLEVGLVAEEHGVADLEGVRMEHEDAEADADAVPERAAEGAQKKSPLARARRTVTPQRAGAALEELLSRMGLAEARGFRDLRVVVSRDLLDAMHGLDGSPGGHIAFMKSRTAPATRSSCSSVSSANIGRESTSSATRSVTGKSACP